jgi:hypothetical protein
MKILVHLIIFNLLSLQILSCSLVGNFVPASIPESAKFAGAVIVGIVENEVDPNAFMDSDIYLTNAQYYKGCGPSRVLISGYSQSSMCGIDAPKSGDKVIVFVCKDGNGWKLNKYVAYAGQFQLNEENYQLLVDSVGDVNTCENETFVYKKCGKRKPQENNNKDELIAPKPVLIEPPTISPPNLPTPTLSPPTLPPKLIPPKNPPYQIPGSFYNPNSNVRNIKVSSRINPFNSNSNPNFPIISKPSQINLNRGNPLIRESSNRLPSGFNSFYSGLFNK